MGIENIKTIFVCTVIICALLLFRGLSFVYNGTVHNTEIGKVSEALGNNVSQRQGFGLYVRMFNKKRYFYDTLLLKSLEYFWPHEAVQLTVVLDDENAEDHVFGKEISERYPYPAVRYEKPVDPKIYGGPGHHRMQRNMFYADKYCNYKYVGFVDTDTLFVTSVTSDLMFEDGKPIVIGQYGKASDFFWSDVARGTKIMFKEPEVMRCMSYFPVIIKVEHLVLLRHYVERLHMKPFDKIFPLIIGGSRFSQFNLMCQYIWKHHRNEYKFHMQVRTPNGQWHGQGNSPFRQHFQYYKDNIKQHMTRPVPRSSIHYRYHSNFRNVETYRNVLLEGICHSGGFSLCKKICTHFNENGLQRPLFQFQGSDWIWDQRCLDVQRQHYIRVQNETTDGHKRRIKKACKEIESLPFNFTK